MPFEDWDTKYSLQALIPTIFSFASGHRNLLREPTIYVLKLFNADIIRDLRIGFLATTAKDNSLLYEKVTSHLGPNVLLKQTIVAVDRPDPNEVKVLVKGEAGELTLLKSCMLLGTIPPKLDNLSGRDLSAEEVSLFGQFTNSGYYMVFPKPVVFRIMLRFPISVQMHLTIFLCCREFTHSAQPESLASRMSNIVVTLHSPMMSSSSKLLPILRDSKSSEKAQVTPNSWCIQGALHFSSTYQPKQSLTVSTRSCIRCRSREICGIQALRGMFMTRAFFGSLRRIRCLEFWVLWQLGNARFL
jgi:hypothetical protein